MYEIDQLQNVTGFREERTSKNPTLHLIHDTITMDFLVREDWILGVEEVVVEAPQIRLL